MNDLLQKLEAAIAETERIALATESLEWIARLEHGDADVAEKDSGYLVAAYREVYPECAISLDDDVAVHIAHNDPKRVLRRVARDRKLLELHTPRSHTKRAFVEEGRRKDPAVAHEPTGALMWTACPTCGGRDWDIERFDDLEPCDTLRLLAENYEIQVED